MNMHDHDPVTLEIIRHDLLSIPNQIDKNVARTAFSPLISEYKDYSVGIVDPEGRLISQSRGSLAIFVANALGTAVRDGLLVYGADDLHEGDVVISNHAATLGQHLNNVVMYTPVRAGPDGRLVAFFCVLVHWIDIGGSMVGSCSSTTTTEIFQEGVQFRTVKLMDRGRRVPELFRMIEYNTRFPAMLLGDLEAQIAGCILGCQEVQEIVQRYGAEALDAAVQAMWRRSDALVREAVRRAPPGNYRAQSFLDDDGVEMDKTVPIDVAVRVNGGDVAVDFSNVADQVRGPVNAGRNGGAVAAARIALKYLFSPYEPVNEGDFRCLSVEIPEGKFLSARPTAAIGSSGVMIPTVVDTILRALSDAFPDRVAAAHQAIYGSHNFFGTDPRTGEPFYALETSAGGWGALLRQDGHGPARSMVHGDTSNVPSEMQEAYYPFRFESYGLRQDSGGPGRFRGGLGLEKIYRVLTPCQILLRMDRTKCPPWGLHGGMAGRPAEVEIRRANGETLRPLKGNYSLGEGDTVIVRTGGGGGYGPAWEREIERVVQDVALEYVSRDSAARDYGVVIDESGLLMEKQTRELRQRMRSAWQHS